MTRKQYIGFVAVCAVMSLMGSGLLGLAWQGPSPIEAQTEKDQVGRYQLYNGEYRFVISGTEVTQAKTLFRIDTVTGEVDQYIATDGKDFWVPTGQ